jgi:hypothetical protein
MQLEKHNDEQSFRTNQAFPLLNTLIKRFIPIPNANDETTNSIESCIN